MSQLAKTIQIEKIVRERDKMLTKLIELQGRLAGIELAIEILDLGKPKANAISRD